MSSTMLDYCKTILEKVSFDARLFQREFEKAMKTLMPDEIPTFIEWVKQAFKDQPVLSVIGLN